METLIVQINGKSEARFIQKVLQQFSAVQDVLLKKNGTMSEDNKEELEMQEDIDAYHAAKALNEVPIPYVPLKARSAAISKM